jgi:hypothetical protein
MAFTGATPEALANLLSRSDSKNPATTCKGITKMGRPCRNPLSIDANRADAAHSGVLAVVSVIGDDKDEEVEAAAFFCWKHKDQADALLKASREAEAQAKEHQNGSARAGKGGVKRQDTRIYPLHQRSSIDTLVARLGVLEVNDGLAEVNQPRRKRRNSRAEAKTGPGRPPRRIQRPPTWDRVQGPLMEIPNDFVKPSSDQSQPHAKPRRKRRGFWESLCCGAADEDDHRDAVNPKRRTQPMSDLAVQAAPRPANGNRRRDSQPVTSAQSSSGVPVRKPLSDKPTRPLNKTTPQDTSETSTLLSYIPKTLSPQLTSTLLAELAKPISASDQEGFIYIFWLTPETAGMAPSTTASSLLAPPSRPEQGRRTSEVLRQYSVKKPQRGAASSGNQRRLSAVDSNGDARGSDEERKTILLKIGRANNVHRRMHEWTRQCGYDVSLVRFYPYVPSSSAASPFSTPKASPSASPGNARRPTSQNVALNLRPVDDTPSASSGVRKVPHVHRVERLIHLELSAQRVIKKCDVCGRDHKEWFEVEATRDGVRAVDKVVKRWVDWAETKNGKIDE